MPSLQLSLVTLLWVSEAFEAQHAVSNMALVWADKAGKVQQAGREPQAGEVIDVGAYRKTVIGEEKSTCKCQSHAIEVTGPSVTALIVLNNKIDI